MQKEAKLERTLAELDSKISQREIKLEEVSAQVEEVILRLLRFLTSKSLMKEKKKLPR